LTDRPTVFLAADMEGTTGYVEWPRPAKGETAPPEPLERREQLLREVNAVIEGAVAGGAGKIIVSDAHWGKKNLDPANLAAGAELIRGGPRPYLWMTGVEKADMVFLVGFHAAAGTADAVLPHTIDPRIHSLHVNGQEAGEALLSALAAGYHGVPVALVSGDRALVKEVQAFLPQVAVVAVKEAVLSGSALGLHPQEAVSRLAAAAHAAVSLAGRMPILGPREPVDLEMTLSEPRWCEALRLVPDVTAKGGRTIAYRAPWPRIMALLALFAGWIR